MSCSSLPCGSRSRFQDRPRCTGAAAALLLGMALCAGVQAAPPRDWVKGRVIVHARAGLPDAEIDKLAGAHGGNARRIGKTGLVVIDLPAGRSETAVAAQLAAHPHLRFAELDAILAPSFVANDPYAGSEWHIGRIGASTAWDQSKGANITIAILDTGVDSTHPDLASRLVAGWNVFDNTANTADVTGHGTAVAGTAAAAINNAIGVAGVAGSASIMPMRICDGSGNATGSAVAQALTWAADHGAKVANISFAGVPGNSTIQTAAQYMKSKGGLVVVAAGNNGIAESIAASSTMIPVSATEQNDTLATWSSYGDYVAVAAPGNYIWTTNKGGGYGQWWGTSFSSPIAAGVVALMMAARPDLPNTQIESLLYSTATDLGTAGKDPRFGYGLVNAAAGVSAALTATAADTQSPSAAISSPAAGASVSGIVAIDVAASDNIGVARVDLKVNGSTVASDTSSPYQFSWDSTRVANGASTLTAVAYDAAGNSTTSSAVSINVANPTVGGTTPLKVSITNPADGSLVNGVVTIGVSATDTATAPTGVTQSLYIDGKLSASGTGTSLSYNWNTKKAAVGKHTLQAVARDTAGNTNSVVIQVTK